MGLSLSRAEDDNVVPQLVRYRTPQSLAFSCAVLTMRRRRPPRPGPDDAGSVRSGPARAILQRHTRESPNLTLLVSANSRRDRTETRTRYADA